MTNKSKGRLLVVSYHYIRDQGGKYPGIHPISATELSDHINKLKHQYHPASIEQVSNFISGKEPLERDSFLITFDDGLQDHYINARNVLDRHNVNGVFFVPTLPYSEGIAPAVHKIHWLRANTNPDEFIVLLNESLPYKWSNLILNKKYQKKASEMHIHDDLKTQLLKFSLNFIIPYDIVNRTISKIFAIKGINEEEFCQTTFMSADQMFKLKEDGHMVAMHGHSHVSFTSLDEKMLDDDIKKNSLELELILGSKPKWLGYPYGRPDAIPDNAKILCKKHKIDAAFSMISGFNQFGDDNTTLKRITPNEINKYLGAFLDN